MAITPQGIALNNGIEFVSYPSNTYLVQNNRIIGMGDNYEAVKQAVEIIFSVERFQWQIYTPNFGTDYRGVIGITPQVAANILRKRVEDAIKADERMTGITDYTWDVNGDSLTVSFTVNTVYGTVPQTVTIEGQVE